MWIFFMSSKKFERVFSFFVVAVVAVEFLDIKNVEHAVNHLATSSPYSTYLEKVIPDALKSLIQVLKQVLIFIILQVLICLYTSTSNFYKHCKVHFNSRCVTSTSWLPLFFWPCFGLPFNSVLYRLSVWYWYQ